ncbi:hypothetical protein WMY93_007537 [Mugilogobius chulae]|uniref:Uncharacterized protein n=1 Tax=Mugilogobius chulae TaxID=88201 RepID=A0AAW0PIE9_9GOBI
MDHDVVTQLVTHFQQRINLYAAIILAFSYHFLFEEDLPCTYRNMKRDFLIDGDWSICCWTTETHNITCKNESLRTVEERITLREIRDSSRLVGLSILLGLFAVAFIISCVHNNSGCTSCSAEGDWLQIVLDEEEMAVSDELRKKAKKQLKKQLNQRLNKWDRWYTVGNKDRSIQRSQDQSIRHSQDRSIQRSQDQSIQRSQERSIQHSQERSIQHSQERSIQHSQERSIQHSQERSIRPSQDQSIQLLGLNQSLFPPLNQTPGKPLNSLVNHFPAQNQTMSLLVSLLSQKHQLKHTPLSRTKTQLILKLHL